MPLGSWIVTIGDEVLSGHTLDTNSNWLAQRLRETPHPVARIVVVPDQEDLIAEVIQEAVRREVARIFCCGGLGPTPDDLTVPALARALGVDLIEDPGTMDRIRARVRQMHEQGRIPSPEPNPGNRKMALIPNGAMVLRNPVGMAPPLALPLGPSQEQRWLLVLPGVPKELKAIVSEEILPVFCNGESTTKYAEAHYLGVPESQFFPLLTSLAREHPGVRFGSYPQAQPGEVIIRACSAEQRALERAMQDLRARSPKPPS